ncbi:MULTISPECIES: DUF4176 domain-containing protein [Streptococcus]|uniref:DUF4176 domain-containing protein n=1 Tax=Streptococcus pantholopis TaxID=1811193 RepID=A0A172Q623_9STRE|nr:DUF4176 domain-containing protein [Streptococcus pantholopis]AND78919.1 hypothetical protein A0O21_02220 [Streptococcus pantholopis]
MENKILPLGSVVTLKGGDDTELMIISRGSTIEELDNHNGKRMVYYDYGSVVIPNGMQSPDTVFFFNRENVKSVLFEGYRNDAEVHFTNHYDSWVQASTVPKGKI